MISKSYELRTGPMMKYILFIALLLGAAAPSMAYEQGAVAGLESHSGMPEISGNFILAASDGLSPGMTKKEVYDKEGVPDKLNRLPGEEGKEMWVYKCQNDDGFNEDCLHLYFDGDRLVKIDRL